VTREQPAPVPNPRLMLPSDAARCRADFEVIIERSACESAPTEPERFSSAAE